MMDTTFISVHDLSQDARILYVSNSITEILGFSPDEVVGRSCWDYFHPDELPFARSAHGRGVSLDRAAVLNYCRIKNKLGRWIGCECVFTVVFDVLVGCTSVYQMDAKSQQRAKDAPIIRQLFSSSPRDPRYHMLSYISSKFSQGPRASLHEPRAALFLNRFTRTLTVMYATNGLANVLGITAAELVGKSFYFCIAEQCLPQAIRCLECAKKNDSIAYLRFWYRDPRQDDLRDRVNEDHSSDQDSEEGGVRLNTDMDMSDSGARTASSASSRSPPPRRTQNMTGGIRVQSADSGTSSTAENSSIDRVFDWQAATQSSVSSFSPERPASAMSSTTGVEQSIEIEAVVSCTSDGLVVVIREARPFVPDSLRQPAHIPQPTYTNGYFASPWGETPILPTKIATEAASGQMEGVQKMSSPIAAPPATASAKFGAPFASPPGAGLGPFMQTIREVAVFAWALTGINGALAQYAQGTPSIGAQPQAGLPVWQPDADSMRENMKGAMKDEMQE